MSENTTAVLEQIRALSDEERRELLETLNSPPKRIEPSRESILAVYEALNFRYEGEPDEAARIHEFRR